MRLRPQLFAQLLLPRRAHSHRTLLPSSSSTASTQLPHHHNHLLHHHHHRRTMSSTTTTSPAPSATSTPPNPGRSPSFHQPSTTPAASAATPTAAAVRPAYVQEQEETPSTTTITTTATTTHQDEDPTANVASPKQQPLPALPAPGTEETETPGKTTTVVVNGAPISLDALGPMVVNRDGTLARIANWQEMSSFERENTLRVLGKRNQLRLATLRGGDENNTAEKKE
ncbi:hypothetical protein QC761_604500 [Podospora bellae-mahoneyi]|uniref:Uncharacterized protein n=1 Tax=Podospora bellae-mahoneyi TaxID=2093777 RepID=A0ABR0F851_9PEZI|nr:hypothetical protein QC761_604500 [Podospora bellae-mahoneyi]